MRLPWRKLLIIKCLGKRLGYNFMVRRLSQLWKLKSPFMVTDLGNEFFLVKFESEEDSDHVLFDGPWMVADQYITVRQWQPNFDPEEASIETVVVWVRLPNLNLWPRCRTSNGDHS